MEGGDLKRQTEMLKRTGGLVEASLLLLAFNIRLQLLRGAEGVPLCSLKTALEDDEICEYQH